MQKENCFYLGKITKTVGYKGELALFMDVDQPENYFQLPSVLADVNGSLIPYFFEFLQFRKDRHFKCMFQGVETIEQAERLVNKELYLPLDILPKLSGKKFYFHEIIGFVVIDQNKTSLGQIQRVIDLPTNPLFEVISESGSEILVPMHDDVIVKVDRDNNTIEVSLPDGFLELYS